ncbi:MAG TPA: ABC transporter substrate-binding protein [Planctomycetota bacterium]|nr:ABC transporter substrate-binding protein [Planctomycetota bacterium]
MDWTTSHSSSGSLFKSKRYSDWPTISEDLTTGTLQAAFLLAPMAMSLKQRGVPLRIVYLGHRDGTAMMVRTDSDLREVRDLRGKKVLVPSQYSNQKLWLARMLKEAGMSLADLDVRDCPPPDMPAMLETDSCAAYIVGEPHAARSEMAGTGRVFKLTKDDWPNFISCVVVVREEMINEERAVVQELIDGIAGSGVWLDQDFENRMEAAEVAGKYYYNQKPELLKFVLSKPPDRVKYTSLSPHRDDLDEIMLLAVEVGMLDAPIAFEEYADPSFAEKFSGAALPMPPDDARTP